MKTKFKVGDKVIGLDGAMAGVRGTVVRLQEEEQFTFPVVVQFDEEGLPAYPMAEHELAFYQEIEESEFASVLEPGLPVSAKARKQTPVATGVLAYFPDAIAEVAKVSYIGNDQHNPGQPLHWARGKSTDQLDAAVRHIMDYLAGESRDSKGNAVLAQAAWRILAELQLSVEEEREFMSDSKVTELEQ